MQVLSFFLKHCFSGCNQGTGYFVPGFSRFSSFPAFTNTMFNDHGRDTSQSSQQCFHSRSLRIPTRRTRTGRPPRAIAPPNPRARAAPPRGGDALLASSVFSRTVWTLRLSAPFCCRSPSRPVGPSPCLRCKLCVLRLGL